MDLIWIPHLVFPDSPTRDYIQNDETASLTIVRQGLKLNWQLDNCGLLLFLVLNLLNSPQNMCFYYLRFFKFVVQAPFTQTQQMIFYGLLADVQFNLHKHKDE